MSGKALSLLSVMVVLAFTTGCDRSDSRSANRSSSEEAERYSDSNDGLKRQVSEIRAAIKAKDQKKIDELLEGLKLPDYERWFRRTFGEAPSAALAAEYKKGFDTWNQLPDFLGYNLEKGDAAITIARVTKPDDQAATGAQQAALKAMKTIVPVALYAVSLDGRSLWSFVHSDGQFRLVGKMRALQP
jgi:hypothetical protein